MKKAMTRHVGMCQLDGCKIARIANPLTARTGGACTDLSHTLQCARTSFRHGWRPSKGQSGTIGSCMARHLHWEVSSPPDLALCRSQPIDNLKISTTH